MLVKPRKQEPQQQAVEKKPKKSHKQVVCNKCHSLQTYEEHTVPLQYSLNGKITVQIDGIERRCSKCGWHVDDVEVSMINQLTAKEVLQNQSV